MFQRIVNPLKSKSFFLFGARATGKSTFLKYFFSANSNVSWIDLMEPSWAKRVRRDPKSIFSVLPKTERILKKNQPQHWIVIDEVQKCPDILDLIHKSLFENKNISFALTGSSARKLKSQGANMLAGRALSYAMFPLTHIEIGEMFDLQAALEWGTLPESLLTSDKRERRKYLESYCRTYMNEEVFAEQLARQLDPFKSFIEIAAQDNGHIINYESIGKQIGVSGKTVANYYSILCDTYLGVLLHPSHPSLRKKVAQKPKFYFFDLGVQRSLSDTLELPLIDSTNAFGDAFEHWVIIEAWRLNTLCEKGYKLSFFEAHGGISVDLVLEKARQQPLFIEIKSTKHVTKEHLKHLISIRDSKKQARLMCVSRDPERRFEEGVEIIPWQDALRELFVQGSDAINPIFTS